jgi:hypothetical protein
VSDILNDHARHRIVAIDDPETLVKTCLPHLTAAARTPVRATSHEQHVRELCREALAELPDSAADVAADLLISLEPYLTNTDLAAAR